MRNAIIILLTLTISSCQQRTFNLLNPSPKTNQIFTTDNILFSVGNSDVLADQCKPTLDSILTFLNSKPTYVIEIGVHTDFRGSEEQNKTVSQKRADKLKEYFTNNGIESERLIPIGYGESKPLRSLKEQNKLGEDAKNVNRRVTLKIIRK